MRKIMIYTNVRMETVFIDLPFGFCFRHETLNRDVWVHAETMGM